MLISSFISILWHLKVHSPNFQEVALVSLNVPKLHECEILEPLETAQTACM